MTTEQKTHKITFYVAHHMKNDGMTPEQAIATVARGLGITTNAVKYAVGSTFGKV